MTIYKSAMCYRQTVTKRIQLSNTPLTEAINCYRQCSGGEIHQLYQAPQGLRLHLVTTVHLYITSKNVPLFNWLQLSLFIHRFWYFFTYKIVSLWLHAPCTNIFVIIHHGPQKRVHLYLTVTPANPIQFLYFYRFNRKYISLAAAVKNGHIALRTTW